MLEHRLIFPLEKHWCIIQMPRMIMRPMPHELVYYLPTVNKVQPNASAGIHQLTVLHWSSLVNVKMDNFLNLATHVSYCSGDEGGVAEPALHFWDCSPYFKRWGSL